jgi:predicted enzyme related to lactoylglutathione lyase
MSVPDVAGVSKQVTAKGGRILAGPRAVAARGDMALLADPDGAPFGLVHSSSGDPPDYLPEIGDFIWALYQSPDATRAAAFYQDLGDYEVVPDDRFPQAPHFILSAEGFARASLVEIPAERAQYRPDWLYFVRVRDVGASLARVQELGGRIVAPPDPAILGGRIAVIADPAGAPLGLMEWAGEGEGDPK